MPGKPAKHSVVNSSSKGKTKKNLQPEESDLELRMRRAMQEAKDEMGETDEEEEFNGFGEDLEQDEGIEENSIDDESSDSGNEGPTFEDVNESMDSDEDDDDEMASEPSKSLQPNHLPDELFTAAFPSTTTKRKVMTAKESQLAKKRKRRNKGHKDKIVGSRVIRTLSNPTNRPAPPSTIPSRKVQAFINRALSIKGSSSKVRGWERKPANLGVFRSSGPAHGFVRNSIK